MQARAGVQQTIRVAFRSLPPPLFGRAKACEDKFDLRACLRQLPGIGEEYLRNGVNMHSACTLRQPNLHFSALIKPSRSSRRHAKSAAKMTSGIFGLFALP